MATSKGGLGNSQWSAAEHNDLKSPPDNSIPSISGFEFPTSNNNTSIFGFGQDSLSSTPVEWDFQLLTLLVPGAYSDADTYSDSYRFTEAFSSAIQYGIPRSNIESVLRFSVMFYAVQRNDPQIIRLLIEYGANINASYGIPPIPLLAFTIIHSKTLESQSVDTLVTLLSLGADASGISKAFYSPYNEDLPDGGPREVGLGDTDNLIVQWSKSRIMRSKLAEAPNLSQRYYLYKARRLSKPTARQMQLARRNGCEDLFAAPFFMIGQTPAVQLLQKSLLQYMLTRRKVPLVLEFAGWCRPYNVQPVQLVVSNISIIGPSGHGKTELARRLRSLLSVELHISDCTVVRQENELFGARSEYVGSAAGAPLNNFLAKNNGQRCIVFLDEFEKTSRMIWNALLIPFENGEYEDRRNRKTIDCKNTIWILTTNALDHRIVNYYEEHADVIDNEDSPERVEIFEGLTEIMQEEFISRFSAPVTGRISAFIPFIPFSAAETFVGAHKYLLQLVNDVCQPVDASLMIGKVRLRIRCDVAVCKVLANKYSSDLGVRCLKKAVKDYIEGPLSEEYLDTDEAMQEGGLVEEFVVCATDTKICVQRVASNVEL